MLLFFIRTGATINVLKAPLKIREFANFAKLVVPLVMVFTLTVLIVLEAIISTAINALKPVQKGEQFIVFKKLIILIFIDSCQSTNLVYPVRVLV